MVNIKKFFKNLGPGLITGASDDDPSGIATYSQAGALFGLSTLWTAWLTFPLMASIQSMCARIGLVNGLGLTGTIKKHYSKPILYLMLIFSTPAIIFNIGADISAMGAVSHMLFPKIEATHFSIFFTIILLLGIIYFPYRQLASILKYLCVVLFLYLLVPFITDTDWMSVLRHTFFPVIRFDKSFLLILVALLGTTISPYLFFWQANMEVEEVVSKKLIINKQIIQDMNIDINVGMFFSNIVMYFIILTTGTVLYQAGLHQIETVDDAARALEPLAGRSAYLLFSLGIIGTGLLSIPVLTGSLSYIFCETFNWREGLNNKFNEARPFYTIIAVSLLIGLSLQYVGISPVQGLLYSAILYGITSPVIIILILMICNNRNVMGEFVNKIRDNILGIITLLLMTISALLLIYSLL
ncbi:MAG: divalent metal cation transporter [Bacteroidetes bacterium]|nr:divalent metal cation transporter [Bacteroidota bacterium]